MRVYHGIPLQLEEHLNRLLRGAMKIYIKIDSSSCQKIYQAVMDVLEINDIKEGTVRITLTRGGNKRGLSFEPGREPNLIITAGKNIPYPESMFQQGLRGIVVSIHRNNFSPLVSLKTLNFLEGVLAFEEARNSGGQEGILTNLQGCLCEGTVSNIFWVKSGAIFTPHTDCGLVPGIVRGTIIKLCHQQGLQVEEVRERQSALLESDEAFLTNSVMEVMPLVNVNNKDIGPGKPGETTLLVRRIYRKFILENS